MYVCMYDGIDRSWIEMQCYPFGVVGVFICVSVCPSVRPFVRSSVRTCTCKFVHVVVLAILFRVAGV